MEFVRVIVPSLFTLSLSLTGAMSSPLDVLRWGAWGAEGGGGGGGRGEREGEGGGERGSEGWRV